MKNFPIRRSLLAVSLCTLFSIAQADDATSEHSYYLGANVGTSKADGFCLSDTNCETKAKNWKVYGGYQLTDLLTLEGGYANLGELGKQPDDSTQSATKISGFTGSLLASFPVQEKMNVFGKAGFFKQKTDADNTTFSDNIKPTYGIGADYEVGEGIAIRGEWENYQGVGSENNTETADIQTLSLGMTFSSL